MSYRNPVTPEVLDNLSEAERTALRIYQKNHPRIWDPALHRINDCPFGYTLRYLFTFNKKTRSWAQYVLLFFKTSHEREGHCNCVYEIATQP